MTRRSDRTRLVSEEAAYWYIRCNDERSMLLVDRREFLAWLKRSPENIAELLRIAELDGKLAREKLIATVTAMEASNVIDLGILPGGTQHRYQPTDSLNDEHYEKADNKTASSWRVAAIAAGVTIALLLAFVLLQFRPVDANIVKTGPSQWQHMTLADGSAIHIDARTELKVDFSDHQRVIHLYAGQAAFEVTKDVKRPFIVRTGVVDAIAVGTRFSVAIDPGVTTTVSEGIVKVTPPGKQDDEFAVMVTAGEELHVSDSGLTKQAFANVAKVNAERKLAWADGWFIFEGETIAEAAAAFNRRNAVQIRIDNPAIAERRLDYFRFQVGSPETFARVLAKRPDIAVEMDPSSNVLRLQLE